MSRAGRLAGVAALAVLAGAPSRAADPPPAAAADFLLEAAKAATSSNFEGEAVYEGGGETQVLRIIHRFARGHETEHVVTLNGAPRELLQEDDRVTCIVPREERMSFGRPAIKGLLRGLTPERLAGLERWYRLEDLGTDRIAGRLCRGVALKPGDGFRYGYQLWAETVSHIPLRVSLVTAQGTVLEQFMFTQVAMPRAFPDAAFALRLAGDPRYRVMTRSLAADAPVATPVSAAPAWRLGRLPPGFQVTLHDVRRLPHESGPVDHTLLSDGLSAVSVFSVHPGADGGDLQGASEVGTVNAYGRVVGGEHVTVVGEAPAEAVRLIGDGLVATGPGAIATAASAPSH